MNQIERLQKQTADPGLYATEYLRYVGTVLSRIDAAEVAQFIQVLLAARESGSSIFFIGNGGSAATASHFANDLAIGTRSWERPFRTVSLTDNVAVMTAIANDYSYDQIFARQLAALCNAGDVVVAISASGNSPNVVTAIRWANTRGAVTVGLTGFDGGELRGLVQCSLHVPTDAGEYGPVEDAHMVIDHLVGSFLAGLVVRETQAVV